MARRISLINGDGNYLKMADKKDWIYEYDWKKKKYTHKKLISKEGIRDINGKPIKTADEFLKAYEGEGIRIPKKGLKWTKNFTPPTEQLSKQKE